MEPVWELEKQIQMLCWMYLVIQLLQVLLLLQHLLQVHCLVHQVMQLQQVILMVGSIKKFSIKINKVSHIYYANQKLNNYIYNLTTERIFINYTTPYKNTCH